MCVQIVISLMDSYEQSHIEIFVGLCIEPWIVFVRFYVTVCVMLFCAFLLESWCVW